MGQDTLKKFMFDGAPVRGELVELSDTWKQVQSHRAYPPAVNTLLGEMLAAAALLSANLKFNGAIVMQIHGDGPVRLLVVECDAELQMRATAKFDGEVTINDVATLTELVNIDGNGRFVITLDPKDKLPGQQAYQGVVPLDGDSVASIIENYMMRSEQLDTRLWLAADNSVSRGLLLQKLPATGGIDVPIDNDLTVWDRTVMLSSTLQQSELLDTDIDTLMRRLFWEETIRVFDPKHPTFRCSCNRERVGNMLKMLGRPEVDSVLEELGMVSIDCEFCGQHYAFDKVDCLQLFIAADAASLLAADTQIKH